MGNELDLTKHAKEWKVRLTTRSGGAEGMVFLVPANIGLLGLPPGWGISVVPRLVADEVADNLGFASAQQLQEFMADTAWRCGEEWRAMEASELKSWVRDS